MKIVCASDSFKGSLSSIRAAELIEKAAREVLGDVEVRAIAMADGGEGTAEALVRSCGGEMISASVHDPLMNDISASYGMLSGGRAVIEMASASGLTLVPEALRDPMITTSYGTGELIRRALDGGSRDISIAIGGSATNDGGMGAMRALGIEFQDANGDALAGTGAELESVALIDMAGLDKQIEGARISVICDVDNPLTGPSGATYVYGPQKGADPDRLEILERGMCNYRDVIKAMTGIDCDRVKGAGAAGGLGAALHVFLGGELRRGADVVLDLNGFDDVISDADLVITGEGRADSQSLSGKVMQAVGLRARAAGVPAVGIAGSLGEGWQGLLDCGISEIIPIMMGGMTTEEAMERAEELYYEAANKFFLTLRGNVIQ